ncbi:MAG: methionyl-tRNA formyltransferase [Desulfuromonadales bacterium]|nr:methionyl-tRNA formyltransferase [Desulfuromonadales bacterium]
MIDPATIRTVFMGTPAFAVPTLDVLLQAGLNLVGVYTQPDRPKGRGQALAAPPVKEMALRHGIPVFQPQKLRAPEVVEELRALAPDLIVVVAFGQILPKSVLEIPRYGCINVHASLLPKYRGAAPINQAIIDGETETGITTMLMDVGLDTGPMLLKRSLTIGPDETAGELHDRLCTLGGETMAATLQELLRGELHPQVQDDSQTCYAAMLKKEDGLINWNQSAQQIHDRIRGLAPWPGTYTELNGEPLKLFLTRVEAGEGEPGTILPPASDAVRIACGNGVLAVRELQLPGKKRLAAADFLRGCPLPVGSRLGS